MSLSPAWLDELRSRTLLSALIGRSIKVTRAGREHKACCPFHNEKTPSFTINDEKGFYHCLAGETKVITDKGSVQISTLTGKTATVLSRNGRWLPASFNAYGTQELWKITLSRNRVTKVIHATDGHRWFVKGRNKPTLTRDLPIGRVLESTFPQTRNSWILDPEGVRHGIIYGDGTLYKGIYGTINLHGEKDVQLRQWFPGQEHHVQERDGGKLFLRIYGGRAFGKMKKLPALSSPASYLLGFLAGYLAADGHVAKDGTVMLNSANPAALDAVRDIATCLGIGTYGKTSILRNGFGQTPTSLHRIDFITSTLDPQIFLLSEARRRFSEHMKAFDRVHWTVKAVEKSNRVERVYCAEVPEEHAFALDDNILTGNCFGCSAHGDAIKWMTDQRGLPFMDAVKELADAAGMEVPAPDPRAAEKAERANSLYDVTAAAAEWFQQQLQEIDGANARSYLDQRGIRPETIKDFGLGFAPDSRAKLKTALARFGEERLIEAGLLIAVEDKQPYDRFRGRLMIPIRDPRGRIIAFGGRILGAGEPKYLNSPDTPLFDKGRTLYNLDRAAAASRKTDRVCVVEGYMDVIALAQVGIDDVVAPLGTALTEHQIARLWRLTHAPTLCFDGDGAGQKAAVRAIGRALPGLSPSQTLQFVTLPKGQDPDDVIRAGGRKAMIDILDKPEPLVERIWREEMLAEPLNTPEAKARLKQRLMAHAGAIGHEGLAGQYRQEFFDRFDSNFKRQAPPRRSGGKSRFFEPERPLTQSTRAIGTGGVEPLYARAIMTGLLNHPAMIIDCAEALSQLAIADDELTALRDHIVDAAFDLHGLDSSQLVTICEKAGFGRLTDSLINAKSLAFSFMRRQADPETARRDLGMAIEALAARPELDAALAAATARLGESLDDAGLAEQQRLIQARHDAEQRLAALVQRDDGADTD